VDVVVAGRSLELTGVTTSGALACVFVAALSVPEVPGVSVARALAESTAAANGDFLAAPALCLSAEWPIPMTRTLIGGALLSASGIEAPAEAVGWLEDSPSPVDDLGRSARPIAKQPANAAAQRAITISGARSRGVMPLPGLSGNGALRDACS
jgi:hypothetical protein